MGWLATLGVIVTLLMLLVWRRWRQSVLDARNFPPSSHSLQPTGLKQTLPVLDPDRVAHQSRCAWCRSEVPVMLNQTRLEGGPWRLVWRCRVCGNVARARVTDEALPSLLALDRAGGMPLSTREVEQFCAADPAEFDDAVRDEIL